LDIGRSSYTVSTALRRVLIIRDGGCAFPGCDRPHRWGIAGVMGTHSEWSVPLSTGTPNYPPIYLDSLRKPERNMVRSGAA
jgi:hypothetical protein